MSEVVEQVSGVADWVRVSGLSGCLGWLNGCWGWDEWLWLGWLV